MATVKVVIIEDDLSIQRLYKTKLELEGFEVTVADNGKDGLSTARRVMPDIILLDLRMPLLNGEETLAKLRAEEWGANIRVIILTNVSRDEAPTSLRFLGVSRYIVKAHHTPAQVVEAIKDVLLIS